MLHTMYKSHNFECTTEIQNSHYFSLSYFPLLHMDSWLETIPVFSHIALDKSRLKIATCVYG